MIGTNTLNLKAGDTVTVTEKRPADHGTTGLLLPGEVYTVQNINSYGVVLEGSDHQSMRYHFPRFVRAETVNGVDVYGNPKNFTRADLKSLQRVVLADGRNGIIAEEGFGSTYGVCVVYDTDGNPYGSFDAAQVNCEFYKDTSLNIVEVYDNPGYGNMYKQSARGNLLWKKVDLVKQRAIKEADEAIAKAEEELAAAKANRAAL